MRKIGIKKVEEVESNEISYEHDKAFSKSVNAFSLQTNDKMMKNTTFNQKIPV